MEFLKGGMWGYSANECLLAIGVVVLTFVVVGTTSRKPTPRRLLSFAPEAGQMLEDKVVRSKKGIGGFSLEIFNETTAGLLMNWISYEGVAGPEEVVMPGGSLRHNTQTHHPFQVSTMEGKTVLLYLALKADGPHALKILKASTGEGGEGPALVDEVSPPPPVRDYLVFPAVALAMYLWRME